MAEDVKIKIANNLTALRKSKGLTQSDVAKALNYSDKSISKWEHADSLPDIAILSSLCEMYGVTLDYLVHENAEEQLKLAEEQKKASLNKANIITIILLAVAVVYLIATTAFVYTYILQNNKPPFWQAFIWGLPASSLVLLQINKRYIKNKAMAIVCSSLLIWTFILSVYLQFLQYNLWLIFIIGIPLQVIIILGSQLKTSRKTQNQ